ncbi:MAG: glutamate--tRNA ligase [Clostridia bacterium]
MSNNIIRTRFAPSPTGFLHIGNLRTALYAYFYAKKNNGQFVLRIEDTDQNRYVEGAVDVIINTLKETGLNYDEGPIIGGPYAPYVQSERKTGYLQYALELIEKKAAYYCFCTKERLETLPDNNGARRYDKHCLALSKSEIDENLKNGVPYVIRQNVPITDGVNAYHDMVFGDISIDNSEMEDQILIKSDGMPTYNFANVIDDHLMNITCVMRGAEYLTSTPKYNMLYDAFHWQRPMYIHLPSIMKDAQHKLSKRDGAASYSDLINKGYIKQAILNYITLLGWAPKDNREKMTFAQLQEAFDIDGISRSNSIFDEAKLMWLNSEYLKEMTLSEFTQYASNWLDKSVAANKYDYTLLSKLLQTRISTLAEIPQVVSFIDDFKEYDLSIYEHKKLKTTLQQSKMVLPKIKDAFFKVEIWDEEHIHAALNELIATENCKNGQIFWPARIAITGLVSTPGGATEIAELLGKTRTLQRMDFSIQLFNNIP